jgi:hypothetical protein
MHWIVTLLPSRTSKQRAYFVGLHLEPHCATPCVPCLLLLVLLLLVVVLAAVETPTS